MPLHSRVRVCLSRLAVYCGGLLGLFASNFSQDCRAQGAPTVRLPQDVSRDLEAVKRDVPLVIDRNRFAEQVPEGAAGITFRLAAIELEGNATIPTSTLEPLWHDLIGHDIPLSAVFDVAARIGAAYRNAGYVLSQALVVRQDIAQAGGRVRLRVVEGYVDHVVVADDVPGAPHIRQLLEPIQRERPLTLATLERRLLLLNDLPGVNARATLRAGTDDGAANMELVIQRDLNAASIAMHNRTVTAIGPVRIEASGERRSLFGAFDREVLRYVTSANGRLNLLAYDGDAPVGANGATVSWAASMSKSKPKAGDSFSFDTDSHDASVGVAYPVLRSRRANLSVRSTLAGYDGSSDILDGLQETRERIRSIRTGLTFDLTDDLGGIDLVDFEIDKGLSGLGASRREDPTLARLGSNPQFTKSTLYLARLQSLGGEWSLLAAATAQFTNDLLTSSEQFGLGGEMFLRAYDPSELLGDSGQAGKLELRYNADWGPATTTTYGFYDTGSVRLRSEGGPSTRESAGSCGLGLRLGARNVKAFLEVAKPLHRPTVRSGAEDVRVFAGIEIDL